MDSREEPAAPFIAEGNPDHASGFPFNVVDSCMGIIATRRFRTVEIQDGMAGAVRRMGATASVTRGLPAAEVFVALPTVPVSIFPLQGGVGVDDLVAVVDDVDPAAGQCQNGVDPLPLRADFKQLLAGVFKVFRQPRFAPAETIPHQYDQQGKSDQFTDDNEGRCKPGGIFSWKRKAGGLGKAGPHEHLQQTAHFRIIAGRGGTDLVWHVIHLDFHGLFCQGVGHALRQLVRDGIGFGEDPSRIGIRR